MKDDQEFNIRFVGLVKARPCLYDNTREDYYLSHMQERAWTAISITIGDGANNAQCKSRWKNLRGSYTKHLKNCGSGSSKRPYYLADYMSFVLPFTKTRQPKGNIVSATSKQPPATYDESVFTDELEYQDLDCEHEKSREEEDSRYQDVNHEEAQVKQEEVDWVETQEDLSESNQDILEGSNPVTAYDKTTPKCGSKKRVDQKTSAPSFNEINKSKRNKTKQRKVTVDDVNKSIFEYFERKKQTPRKLPHVGSTEDADTHFLLSLLPDFRKMKDSQKRRFKVGILQLAGQILEETEKCDMAAPSSSGASSSN